MSQGLLRVLVLTGTSDHPFPRLLDALPSLVRDGTASEVRVQSRLAPTPHAGIVALGLLSREEVRAELEAADVVISHGGSGSCFDAIRAGHHPIVVARRHDRGEAVDDHQRDLAESLAEGGLAHHLVEVTGATLAQAVRACPRRTAASRPPASSLGARLRSLLPAIRGTPASALATALRTRVVSSEEYATRTAHLPLASPLQTAAWGDARRKDGWEPQSYVVVDAAGRVAAGAQTLRRTLPFGPLYLPYGPSMAEGPEGVRAARTLLLSLSRGLHAGVLWAPAWFHGRAGLLASVRTRPVSPPSWTGLLDLSLPDPELRRQLRGTWRRELEKAERDPTITVGSVPARSIVARLLDDVATLARQRGFAAPVAAEVGLELAEAAHRRGHPELLAIVASAEGLALATYVVAISGGVAQTLWTAGADDPRAAGAGRLALFAALGRARGLGARTYDLAGIDDVGNPGVAGFKRGLRPTLVEVPGLRWIPPAWLGPAAADLLAPVIRRFVGAGSK